MLNVECSMLDVHISEQKQALSVAQALLVEGLLATISQDGLIEI